jgi:L-2-hydroxyglutarate oxidase LhgO
MPELDHQDICIVGAGVVGLAIAHKISIHPVLGKRSVVLLEKNRQFGQETSSRNSEVIHAGIYYPTGSLKARLCVDGRQQLYHYCNINNIPYLKTGKLIIGGQHQEQGLHSLHEQAITNGVNDLRRLTKAQLNSKEPEINASVGLFSPSSGIIDSHAYMQSLLHHAENAGILFAPLTQLLCIEKTANGFLLTCQSQDINYRFTCSQLVNAAGLSAQEVAQSIADFPQQQVPQQELVKGSYFTLQGKTPFQHLIYPLPEKNLRGLGVHVTLDMSGQAKFGPDTEPVSRLDYAVDNEKQQHFKDAIANYYPGIHNRILQPAYSGIRPKLKTENAAADFVIQDGTDFDYKGLVQLFGIESPGLTASLAIGDAVTNLLSA